MSYETPPDAEPKASSSPSEPCLFASNPLDPADHLRYDAKWQSARQRDPRSRYLVFFRQKVLMTADEPLDLVWLSAQATRGPRAAGALVIFLGLAQGRAHYAVDLTPMAAGDTAPMAHKGLYMDVRSAAMQLDDGRAGILAQARALLSWHSSHGFCSVCGSVTNPAKAGHLRTCTNVECGAEHFPRTDPVVIMLPLWRDMCLLGRQSIFPKGMYSAIAGFVEPGESLEEAVRRETLEEVSIRVGKVSYVASQPWPFPYSLMIGCFAQAQNVDHKVDTRELEDARWVTREEARLALEGSPEAGFTIPPPLAIAHHLLRSWIEQEQVALAD